MRKDENTLSRTPTRGGFTLIELLVAVGIFLFLSTIALTALDNVTGGGGDKVPSAVRTLQAALESAKQKAAASGRPVGLRAVIEQTPESASGHFVREFEFVAVPPPDDAGALDATRGWLAFIEEVPLTNGTVGIRQWRVGQLTTAPTTPSAMFAAGASPSAVPWTFIDGGDYDGDGVPDEPELIRPGNRIWIGAENNGAWYTISGDDPLTAGYSEFGPDQNELATSGNDFYEEWMTETPVTGVASLQNNYLTLVEEYRNTRVVSRMQRDRQTASGVELHTAGPLRGIPSDSSVAFYETLLDSAGLFELPTTTNGFNPFLPPPVGSATTNDQRSGATQSFFVPYRIEGGVQPLAELPTVTLPDGVWVDLDASTTSQLGTPSDRGGDGSGLEDPYAPFTIMFRPDGSVDGDLARFSRIFLYVADEDTLGLLPSLTASPDAPYAGPGNVHPRTSAAAYESWAVDLSVPAPTNANERYVARRSPLPRPGFVPAIPIGDHRLISITTRSGLIESGQIYPVDNVTVNNLGGYVSGDDTTPTPDGWADQPQLFVVAGEAVE